MGKCLAGKETDKGRQVRRGKAGAEVSLLPALDFAEKIPKRRIKKPRPVFFEIGAELGKTGFERAPVFEKYPVGGKVQPVKRRRLNSDELYSMVIARKSLGPTKS